MITSLIVLAILAAFGLLLARPRDPAGSSDIVDRDAQRLRAELGMILDRAGHR